MRVKGFWPRVDIMLRRLAVSDLAQQGMSARAIADYVGVEKRAITRVEKRALRKLRSRLRKIIGSARG